MNKNIGIIGFGNMGQAIAERIKLEYKVCIFDKDDNKTKNLSRMEIARDIPGLIKRSEVVILAVKPQDFAGVLAEIKDWIGEKLVISIAAGITTNHIEKALGRGARVIRVMPNMPAKIAQGISCLSRSGLASKKDLDLADKLFHYLGQTVKIKEELMNSATAVSGSGPAYVLRYLKTERINLNKIPKEKKESFLNDFKKSAQGVGFTFGQAKVLTEAVFSGTVSFLRKTKIAPGDLIKQVASKGGTTEAALRVLDSGGSLVEAVKAAKARADELSGKD